ncbi:MAG: septal ring lytic transglycosylase RlpA family protein [Hyphomicrobiaceae bacterium]
MKFLSGACANMCACLLCFVKASFFVFVIFSSVLLSRTNDASAKGPGVRYCFYSTCHRVLTLKQTRARVGKSEYLVSSYYDDCKRDVYNPCGLTSSGEPFFPGRHDNAASPIYPDGTVLLLWNPATKKSAVVRVNNAGPYWGNRKLDVSRAVAEKLGFFGRGIAKLKAEVISAPNKAEATYKKNRRYPPVAGYIGSYETFESARLATAAVTAVNALAASTLALPVGAAVSVARTEKVQTRWQKLNKINEHQKALARRQLIANAESERLTRMARVSEAPLTLSNRPMHSIVDAVAPARTYTSRSKGVEKIPDGRSAVKVARVNSRVVAHLLPVAKADDQIDTTIQKAIGRRGIIARAQTSAPRMQVTLAPPTINHRLASVEGLREFATVAMEIQHLRASDFERIAKGHPIRRILVSRATVVQHVGMLRSLSEGAEQQIDVEDHCPSPKRDMPDVPKKIARADTNSFGDTYHAST